jgi:hypothetical protein
MDENRVRQRRRVRSVREGRFAENWAKAFAFCTLAT